MCCHPMVLFRVLPFTEIKDMNTVRTLQVRHMSAKSRTSGWRDPVLDALAEMENQYRDFTKDNETVFEEAYNSDYIEIEVRILKR